jgi:uncharacterized protein
MQHDSLDSRVRARPVVGHPGVAALALVLAACQPTPPPAPSADEHRQSVDAWSEGRIEKLRQPDGWLSLVGLYWLRPGINPFGSDSSNALIYPAVYVPARLGDFRLDNDTVRFDAAPGVSVTHEGEPVASVTMAYAGDDPTLLRSGSLAWLIIRRGDRLAVRARDTLSAVRTGFAGIERFPVDIGWRFAARFVTHEPADTIEVPNVLGTVNHTASPGTVVFVVDGRKYSLRMWKDSDDPANFFTAFADRTNGGATYGGGRFLWVDAPDADGWTVVDFNRAYNPPCVFTEYATCPLPPRENRLPFAIEAGERMYGGGH